MATGRQDLSKRRGMMSAHLSRDLRARYKRRSMSLRKGDEIKIVRGKLAGKTGTVEEVNTGDPSVFVSGLKLKRTIGTEKSIPITPSNVIITNLVLSDGMRQRILLRKVKELKFEEKTQEPKPAEEMPRSEVKTEAKVEPKAETKTETKQEKAEPEKKAAPKKKEAKKNEPKKAASAKVLAGGKKGNKVGSVTKTRSA